MTRIDGNYQVGVEESFKIKGEFEIKRIRNGRVVEIVKSNNIITQNGITLVADLLGRKFNTVGLCYIAIGTDDGTSLPLDNTNTSLGNEIGRQPITSYSSSYSAPNIIGVYSAFFDANYPSSSVDYTIKEVGSFSSGTLELNTGTLFNRSTLASPVTKVGGTDSLIIDLKVTIG